VRASEIKKKKHIYAARTVVKIMNGKKYILARASKTKQQKINIRSISYRMREKKRSWWLCKTN